MTEEKTTIERITVSRRMWLNPSDKSDTSYFGMTGGHTSYRNFESAWLELMFHDDYRRVSFSLDVEELESSLTLLDSLEAALVEARGTFKQLQESVAKHKPVEKPDID